MPVCYVALGGNLGAVEKTFDRAVKMLRQSPGVAVGKVSRSHRTVAIGEQAGREFVNAAIELTTQLPALALLDLLQSVENRLGRTRDIRWGSRTLDLDLIFHGLEIIESPRLTVPHPACWYRRFVLDPLVEIAPDFVHPVKQVSVGALHARLLERPLRVVLTGGADGEPRRLAERMRGRFAEVEFSTAEAGGGKRAKGRKGEEGGRSFCGTAGEEPTFIVWLGPPAARDAEFRELPLVPRIDATASSESSELFVEHLLQSALGE